MSFLCRIVSALNVGAAVTFKTLKYSRPTLCAYFHTKFFGVDKIVTLRSYESRRRDSAAKLKLAVDDLHENIVTAMDNMDTLNIRDIQELIYTAEEQDVELIIAALKRIELQPKHIRFSGFCIDAVVMRMFAYLKLPEKACEAFLDEDLKNTFVGYNSFVILADMLYKNGLYQNVLDCIDCLERRQNFSVWSCRTVNSFYFTSCLKLNTPEALQKGLVYYQKHLRYREALFEHTMLACLIAFRCDPEKLVYLLDTLPDALYLDIKMNFMLQQLLSSGKVSDAKLCLDGYDGLLMKDTHDLFLTKSNSDIVVAKMMKQRKVLDVSLEEWVIQENSKSFEETRPYKRDRWM